MSQSDDNKWTVPEDILKKRDEYELDPKKWQHAYLGTPREGTLTITGNGTIKMVRRDVHGQHSIEFMLHSHALVSNWLLCVDATKELIDAIHMEDLIEFTYYQDSAWLKMMVRNLLGEPVAEVGISGVTEVSRW